MTVDIFALRVVGARVRIEDSPNEQMNGIEGTIERVTNKVFLLSPANVDVAAEAKRLAHEIAPGDVAAASFALAAAAPPPPPSESAAWHRCGRLPRFDK